MKKFIKYAGLFAVISFIAVSCKKDDILDESSNPIQLKEIRYELNNIPLEKVAKTSMVQNTNKSNNGNYLYDYAMLATNPDDADDEKINNLLFKLTEATAPLIKDVNFNQLIISMAANSETQSANLLDLQNTAPNYYNQINQNLSVYGLSLQLIEDGLTHQPIAPNMDFPETAELEYYVQYYVPSIFVPNIDLADPSLQPLISPNLEVNALEDESLEDNVVGWYYETAESENVSESLVDEESSLITTNPLFFIDNGVTSVYIAPNPNAVAFYGIDSCMYADSSSGKISSKNNAAANQLTSTKQFHSYEHSIKSNYGYESRWSEKSEFAIAHANIKPNGSVVNYFGGVQGYKVINSIKRNQTYGQMQYKWSYHAPEVHPQYNSWYFPTVQSGVNYMYWNTFERDWNRGWRGLGSVTRNGSLIRLQGRMKYSGDWYAWIPSTLWVHNTQFVWIDYDWAHWNNSWKSDFRIWKVFI